MDETKKRGRTPKYTEEEAQIRRQARERVYTDQQTDRITVRVPKGMRERIEAYRQRLFDETGDERYRSVNAMIVSYLQEELDTDFSPVTLDPETVADIVEADVKRRKQQSTSSGDSLNSGGTLD